MSYSTIQDIYLAIAKGGEVRGYSGVQKFGTNDSVGTTFVPVTDGGVYRTPQSSGAKALRIRAGGDPADIAGGVGAQMIRLPGLDLNFEAVTHDLITAGGLASEASDGLFTRLPRAYIPPEGSGTYASASAGSHVGEIIIEDTDGNEWARIHANGFPYATTQIAAYSVAAGDIAYIMHTDIFTDSTKTTNVVLFTRENIDETGPSYSPMKVFKPFTLKGGSVNRDWSHAPKAIVGPADIGYMAKVGVGPATVSAGFDLLIQHADAV